MTEQKVKNRGWVKNVAIIFLAVMLVLTFFSNTIMNASLPEAAVQYVQSGAITTQIRGTGTIEAKEVYQVKTTTSRKIQSVLVTRGQEVKVGDVLVLLAAGEGEELKTLQTQLEEAQYSYQQKLINMGGGSSEVKRAQEKLQEAIAKRDANVISAEEVELAKLRYEAAVDEHQRMRRVVIDAQHALGAVDDGRVVLRAVVGPGGGHGSDGSAAHAVDAHGVVIHGDGAAVGEFLVQRAQARRGLHHHLVQQELN